MLRRVLGFYLQEPGFRICHISIQKHHLHLIVTTSRYARHALAYVLNNWRRHREDFANGRMLTAYLDEYSSALSFDGWTMTFARPRDYDPLPVSRPRTWLLREGWKRHGRIDPHECPGPLEHSFRW